jgi:L-fuconolactonase
VRIDAHQHFWRFREAELPWVDESMSALRRDFLPGDLHAELERNGVDGCIAVQARASLEERRWLLEVSRELPFVRGVVGWVDLCGEDVDERLAEFADEPRFVGVRHLLQDEPEDDYMLGAGFRRGLRALGRRGLAYDLLILPRHLPIARRLVEQLPEQRFVLDHLAKPRVRKGALEPWARDLRALAELPNVCCKVSGLVTEAADDWMRDDFGPYLEAAFDAFGPERLLFGSDWPVCLVAAEYAQVLDIVERHASKLSPAEVAGIFGGNAARVYRLPPESA